jgi:hypothetical protein
MMKGILIGKWGLEWFSKNKLDGITRHLIYENCIPIIFHSREEARKFSNERFGYIKVRKDLRVEPHGWRMPRPVKLISVEYEEGTK